ncbi:hypothetical protein [Dyadobacter sp. CY312]|uniref:hypothetical protein n=1 Tax=Dyadobacter sp. CY312 TaxID=2907303 RepID=UPI001F2A5809|nr:hypothetical protein [Dyadobacter sp. CY312]MCE7042677.1 hypothetical protein [Dyadobacter sp. CY312]
MFRQFAIGRFMIGFIVFVLAYMVATLSYDKFFQLLTAGMFILTIYIMNEIRKGHLEELEKKDKEFAEKVAEMEDLLIQKENQIQQIIRAITIEKQPDQG